jgi:hypothetical protein
MSLIGTVDFKNINDGAQIIKRDGNTYYYLNGLLHREDGPALQYKCGYKEWYINGKYHREDGPAIEDANGNKYWYLNDINIDVKDNYEFLRIVKLKVFM